MMPEYSPSKSTSAVRVAIASKTRGETWFMIGSPSRWRRWRGRQAGVGLGRDITGEDGNEVHLAVIDPTKDLLHMLGRHAGEDELDAEAVDPLAGAPSVIVFVLQKERLEALVAGEMMRDVA